MAPLIEEHPEVTEELTEFAQVSRKTQGFLTPCLMESAKGHEAVVLGLSWKKALETGAFVSTPGTITFQVHSSTDPATVLCAVLKPNAHEGGMPWYMTYAGEDKHGVLANVAVPGTTVDIPEDPEPVSAPTPAPAPVPAATPASPKPAGAAPTNTRDLRNYAFMWISKSDGHHVNALEEIASRALPEPWGFGEGDYSILQSYITQTFYKLRLDGMVLENKGRTFAAMNSGLVTPRYEDLYLCFVPNTMSGKQPWTYAGVCTQFDNSNKKLSAKLRATFPEMPQRARFFNDVSDIVFDASLGTPLCNWEHIIIENVDRIPTDFIASQLYGRQAAEIRELVESIDYDPDRGSDGDPFGDHAKGLAGEQFDELRAFLTENPSYFNRIKAAMDGALDRACVRAAYSFRTGVPSFYPAINDIQILLPLCLMDEDVPDCALVTNKDEHGRYEGRTILTLRMAYKNARLLCRPESEWLSV